MSLSETALVRQRSAAPTGSKLLRDSMICRFNNSASQSSLREHASRCPIRKLYKDNLSQRSNSTPNTSRKIPHKGDKQNNIDQCSCLHCLTPANNPVCLQELESKLTALNIELWNEKSKNQLLQRNVWMAKKSIKREIGGNFINFERLLQKTSDNDWIGRQQRIFILKRKLRDLNKMVEELEDKNQNVPLSEKFIPIRKQSSISIIPEERQLFWCLELERQSVLRSADREKQRFISDRDSLKTKLEKFVKRNKELVEELKNLQEKIKMTPDIIEKGMAERALLVEKQFKTLLNEKIYTRQRLEYVQYQICVKTKGIYELRAKVILEKQIANDQEALLESLKRDEIHLSALLEEIKNGKGKEAIMFKKNLDDMEKYYKEMNRSVGNVLSSMSDSKQVFEIFKRQYADHRFVNFMKDRDPNLNKDKNGIYMASNDVPSTRNGLESLAEIAPKCSFHSDEARLQKYRSIIEAVTSKNIEESTNVNTIIAKINEYIMKHLSDCNTLGKLKYDIGLLKMQIKKYRKVSKNPSKLKLVKKKNSNQSIGNLDWWRHYFNVLETENRFMKSLIKRMYNIEHADFSLFEAFLCTNKLQLLEEISM